MSKAIWAPNDVMRSPCQACADEKRNGSARKLRASLDPKVPTVSRHEDCCHRRSSTWSRLTRRACLAYFTAAGFTNGQFALPDVGSIVLRQGVEREQRVAAGTRGEVRNG
jgi:hypothetical protein